MFRGNSFQMDFAEVVAHLEDKRLRNDRKMVDLSRAHVWMYMHIHLH